MILTSNRRAAAPILILLVVVATACTVIPAITGPPDLGDLRVSVDNRSGSPVVVRATTIGDGLQSGGDATVDPRGAGELIARLAPQWEVAVGGRHLLGSGERPELAIVAGAPRRDILVEVVVGPDGAVVLKSARLVAPQRSPDA